MSNLPFLRRKQTGIAGPLTEYRKPDPEGEGHHDKEDNDNEGLHACARDIISCIESKDEAGLAAALKSAFELCDSEPHEEGPHTNEQESEEE